MKFIISSKTKLILFILLFLSHHTSAQIDFESQIQNIANDIAKKLDSLKQISILAVSDFLCEDGKVSDLGKAIAEELSIDLTNTGRNFKIVDRQDLALILKEHQLATTGILNTTEIKQLGKFHVADAIVIGKLSSFGDYIKVNVKIMSTTDALIVGGVNKSLSNTDAIKKLFNCNSDSFNSGQNHIVNSKPTNLTSNSENSKSLNSDCAVKQKGDFSFTNNTTKKLTVYIEPNQNDVSNSTSYYSTGTNLTVLPNTTEFLYQIGAGPHHYKIYYKNQDNELASRLYLEGNINVIQCGSGNYNIK